MKGFKYHAETTEEETCLEDRVLPPMKVLPKRHPDPESSDSIEPKPAVDKARRSQQNSGKHLGLKTLLEEIGVSDEYRRHHSETAPWRYAPIQMSKRTSIEKPISRAIPSVYQRRCLSGESESDENWRERHSKGNEADHSSEGIKSGSHRQPTLLKNRHRDRRVSKEENWSPDSYSREKEAMFDQYESDINQKRNSDPLPRNDARGNPSPGEGLRNALGNIENRLNENSRNKPAPRNQQRRKQSGKESGKGFATLVEELVQRPERGISKNKNHVDE